MTATHEQREVITMRKLTARQTLRVTRELARRYPREITIQWTRAEFNAKLAEIADEMFGGAR